MNDSQWISVYTYDSFAAKTKDIKIIISNHTKLIYFVLYEIILG